MSLVFPFPDAPQRNQTIDICPEVKWLRSPLPLTLDHINCYLIKDGDGWAIVDTGMNVEVTRKHWETIISTQLNNAPITKVIVTHQHPDHVGLAGWLCREHKAPLLMSESEYLCSRMYFSHGQADAYWEVEEFFSRSAMNKDTIKGLMESNNFYETVYELPPSFHRVKEGQLVTIGDHQWLAINTRGHSPEHLSLYCEALDIYISGDQVLPKITSNVSITSVFPESSPLADWYEAHERIPTIVPDSVLVLPAHEKPFKGLHYRLADVIAHHEERLDKLMALCQEPLNAQQLTIKLFERELDAFQNYLAVGECLAHVHFLLDQGKINRSLVDGVYYYQV